MLVTLSPLALPSLLPAHPSLPGWQNDASRRPLPDLYLLCTLDSPEANPPPPLPPFLTVLVLCSSPVLWLAALLPNPGTIWV